MSDHHSGSDGADTPQDDPETLAALDALEGRGVRFRSSVDPELESRTELIAQEFEAAAGAVFAAWPRGSDSPAPPAGFQDRLEQFVLGQVSSGARDGAARPGSPVRPGPRKPALEGPGPSAPRGFAGALAVAGWLVAAGLLVYGLLAGVGGEGTDSTTVRERFDKFVAEGHALEGWASTDPASTVDGGVAWDDKLNTGFMQIAGLPANDPRVEQYQLWIFRSDDPTSEPHPVDGGVFDVSSDGEVIVPIDAKLNVGHASIFAVTVENPGGVVVSDRTRLPILAKRAG